MRRNAQVQALTPRELQDFERKLLELRAALQREVGRIERDALEPSGGARFQPVDESIEETSLDAELEALATQDELGYAVNEALERLTDGRFGQCVECGRPIARERLALLPYARECRDCRAASESAG
ncbi:MAG: TraR/DksA C4-type zinc finger protein [Planctomycetes bacterium]|nr:TraR/DksA C4-type zinc finger protein [Planctomycetota bacterium]